MADVFLLLDATYEALIHPERSLQATNAAAKQGPLRRAAVEKLRVLQAEHDQLEKAFLQEKRDLIAK